MSRPATSRRVAASLPVLVLVMVLLLALAATGQELPVVRDVEAQPFLAHVQRLEEALTALGQPLTPAESAALARARGLEPAEAVAAIQKALEPHVLLDVSINPESRVKVARGPARAELVQHGWRAFLVRVHNQAGVTAELRARSPNAEPPFVEASGAPDPPVSVSPVDVLDRWMDLGFYTGQPLERRLSGLSLEYRVLEIYARDAGQREGRIALDVGQGTQDLGFRSEASLLFTCLPSVAVTLDVKDTDDRPVTASFLFRDERGRVYPTPSRRLAPDFFFQPQVYRATGETVLLPPGRFTVECTRGPEYRVERRSILVPEGVATSREAFQLRRWIHPRTMGWYSGDHHVHGGGCAHYESPTAGVTPEVMLRHITGEDLNVGCVLSWGPCWYPQKKFFEGAVHRLSTEHHLMRYDVEVSGFPSDHAGHLCLLRLEEDDYPGTTRIEEWPSWDLPVLQWAKRQGAVVGFSHSGFGLSVDTRELPNHIVPAFDGIGANEYIVDVVHDAVDFISSVDTPYVWELNIWYHTLNCGFRTRLSGETDFPCIYGERVGMGRVYCRLDKLDFDRFCDAIRDGRSYVSDGRSHLLDFAVGGVEAGTAGSELRLDKPGKVKVTARVAARLEETPDPALHDRPYQKKPYWHLERARIAGGRKVPVELVVNGLPAAATAIEADGSLQPVAFEVAVERSSWIALRILPSAHTNPVFALVGGKPVRASRRSAEWCLQGVDQCWKSKVRRIRPTEREAARAAYEAARVAYRKILAECDGG